MFTPGKHGSTFGGNPLACTAVVTTIDTMKEENLLDNASRVGRVITDAIGHALAGVAGFVEVRGMGMMIGVELDRPCSDIITLALERGLVLNVTADSVIRLLPPLVMSEAEGRLLADILVPVVKEFLARTAAAAPVAKAG